MTAARCPDTIPTQRVHDPMRDHWAYLAWGQSRDLQRKDDELARKDALERKVHNALLFNDIETALSLLCAELECSDGVA